MNLLAYWKERLKSLSAYLVIIGILFGIYLIVSLFFHKQQATSTTKTKVESGGVANITNINNPIQDLKQGIYLRGSSDRVSIGVFKELGNNFEVAIGGGKKYDDGEFVEVETKVKF